jgi:hypothetical protein
VRRLLACLYATLLAASVTGCAKRHDGSTVRRNFAPSYSFNPPAGWAHMLDGREWTWTGGGARHVLRVFPYPGNDVDAFASAWERRSRARGNSVNDEGRLRICEGGAARHWRILSGRGAGRVAVHYLVTTIRGGLGVGEYEHPASVPAKPDALRALATICPGIASFPTFAGGRNQR